MKSGHNGYCLNKAVDDRFSDTLQTEFIWTQGLMIAAVITYGSAAVSESKSLHSLTFTIIQSKQFIEERDVDLIRWLNLYWLLNHW